jgi:hypothetical protein
MFDYLSDAHFRIQVEGSLPPQDRFVILLGSILGISFGCDLRAKPN